MNWQINRTIWFGWFQINKWNLVSFFKFHWTFNVKKFQKLIHFVIRIRMKNNQNLINLPIIQHNVLYTNVFLLSLSCMRKVMQWVNIFHIGFQNFCANFGLRITKNIPLTIHLSANSCLQDISIMVWITDIRFGI